jgi:SpoVK/Ycf46/Vps4 family AAA+-type ATPase
MLSGKDAAPKFSHDFPAEKLSSKQSWPDLILEYDTKKQLEEIKEWLDFEDMTRKNNEEEGFRRGYKCLFHGPPGTGKTMAATLIGKLTHREVYRIDLSMVTSKYIGETEKNLSNIFEHASQGDWILFFDEADALFGKRGATHNAHDRYANQEVSYLLQRFEAYEGVSILASNFKENIDSAFTRRFNSIVSFKVPESAERLLLWESHLPKGYAFDEDINLSQISQNIKITGAGIYNVMRRSCMKAALRGDKILSGSDMLDSVRQEFAKENKML